MKFLLCIVAVYCFVTGSVSVNAWSVPRHAAAAVGLGMSATAETSTSSTTAVVSTNHRPLSRTGHDNEAWKATYTSCPRETLPTVLEFPDLPSDFPVGTYFRNGHGRFESDDGIRVQHMFDGDGMVSAVTFDPKDKRVLFRNRFIRTEGFVRDKETGTMSQPGTFGTKVSGGFLKNLFRTDFKNVANTHMLYSEDGTLYALWEGGWPYKLDPLTLENDVTAEPKGTDLDGLLKPGQAFAAHYRYDPASGNYVSFGVGLNPGDGTTKINLYEMDSQMKSTRSDEVSIIYEGTGLTHDYALTENWHVFSFPPASVDKVAAFKALFGLKPFAGVIDFEESDKASILLIPRMKHLKPGTAAAMSMDDSRIKLVQVPYHFSFHCANAFENKNGDVVLDMVLMNKAVTGADMPLDRPVWESADWDEDVYCANYVRFTMDPTSEKMTEAPKVITSRAPEFPTIPLNLSTRQHRFSYTVGSHKEFEPDPLTGKGTGAAGAIMKVDTENPSKNEAFSFLSHEFVGEPYFVPKVGADVTKPNEEDRGYVLVYVVDGINLTTDMVIFDVEGEGKLEAGPVGRLRLPVYIPPALHGIFAEGVTFDF